MAPDDPRCPYCVEGNDFKLLRLVGDVLHCERCGHQSRPVDSIFICYCPQCKPMRLSSRESGKKRATRASRSAAKPPLLHATKQQKRTDNKRRVSILLRFVRNCECYISSESDRKGTDRRIWQAVCWVKIKSSFFPILS